MVNGWQYIWKKKDHKNNKYQTKKIIKYKTLSSKFNWFQLSNYLEAKNYWNIKTTFSLKLDCKKIYQNMIIYLHFIQWYKK